MQLETKLYNNIWKIYKDKWWEKKMDVIHEINILINVLQQYIWETDTTTFLLTKFHYPKIQQPPFI